MPPLFRNLRKARRPASTARRSLITSRTASELLRDRSALRSRRTFLVSSKRFVRVSATRLMDDTLECVGLSEIIHTTFVARKVRRCPAVSSAVHERARNPREGKLSASRARDDARRAPSSTATLRGVVFAMFDWGRVPRGRSTNPHSEESLCDLKPGRAGGGGLGFRRSGGADAEAEALDPALR